MADPTIRIGPAETITVVREVLAPGVHIIIVHTAGNSVLSSAYVKSGAGSATVKWYDFGSSNGEEPAARVDLSAHPSLTIGQKSRIVVTRIHNSCRVEVTVTGGSAEVMVLASLVEDFPIDFDGKADGTVANLVADEGVPITVYDPTDGKFYLLRGKAGVIFIDTTADGAGKVVEASATIDPGPEVAVLTETVPAGKSWKLKYAEVVCRGHGRWRLTLNGARLGGGVTGAPRSHDRVDLPPAILAAPGDVVEVLYTYGHGPSNLDVDAFVGLTES